MKTSLIIFTFTICFSHSCVAQTNQTKECDMRALKNIIDSIPLAVFYVQNSETAPHSTLYRVQELSQNSLFSDPSEIDFLPTEPNESLDKDFLKNISKECWLHLLNHPEYDWKTNLFLYFLYEKDALFLVGMKREEWRANYKDNDIKLWVEYFNSP